MAGSWIGVAVGLGTGAFIALQSVILGRVGASIGPMATGIWSAVVSGVLATAVILAYVSGGRAGTIVPPTLLTWISLGVTGLMGICILAGISYSVGTVGATTGLAAVIAAQLIVALAIDAAGLTPAGRVGIDWTRAAGLAALVLAMVLLRPQQG